MTAPQWSVHERARALEKAEREGVDLLIVGGGITGAGILRDAASRGLTALVVERGDFASGTSGRSTKLIHGGLRYIAQGQIGMTRESCRERDLLIRLNPHLVRPIPFLWPVFEDSKMPMWQVRAGLFTYWGLAGFRSSARSRMLGPEQVAHFSRDLRREGLRGAGFFHDGQVDDARLVLETLVSARRFGGEAVNHAEVFEFLRGDEGRIVGARVRDEESGEERTIRAEVVVNAAGPAVERVRGLDRPVAEPELRPAKGVHLVIPRRRVHCESAIVLEARDGRHLSLIPWDEVALIGTTDCFTDEIDEPVVTIEEVHYMLSAANDAFPRLALTTNDISCAFAGVRPLVADGDEESPSNSVSREHKIYEDPSGLISVTGGKLTTYRAMGESVVKRALARLPEERKAAAGPSLTASHPLREDEFEVAELEAELEARYGLGPHRIAHLVRTHGLDAEELLRETDPELRRPIGESRYTYAEIPWCMRTECAVTLCDLLEHRMRLALFAIGQGLRELDEIARVAAEATGWDAERAREEAASYVSAVRTRYQIAPPPEIQYAA
jgi:glycerol-3-phosphate dehydrogenase